MIGCPNADERLTDLIDGRLDEDQAASLRAHLDVCAICASELSLLERGRLAVASLPRAVAPAGFLAAVHQRMETGAQQPEQPERVRVATPGRVTGRLGHALAAGLVGALLCGGTLLLLSDMGRSPGTAGTLVARKPAVGGGRDQAGLTGPRQGGAGELAQVVSEKRRQLGRATNEQLQKNLLGRELQSRLKNLDGLRQGAAASKEQPNDPTLSETRKARAVPPKRNGSARGGGAGAAPTRTPSSRDRVWGEGKSAERAKTERLEKDGKTRRAQDFRGSGRDAGAGASGGKSAKVGRPAGRVPPKPAGKLGSPVLKGASGAPKGTADERMATEQRRVVGQVNRQERVLVSARQPRLFAELLRAAVQRLGLQNKSVRRRPNAQQKQEILLLQGVTPSELSALQTEVRRLQRASQQGRLALLFAQQNRGQSKQQSGAPRALRGGGGREADSAKSAPSKPGSKAAAGTSSEKKVRDRPRSALADRLREDRDASKSPAGAREAAGADDATRGGSKPGVGRVHRSTLKGQGTQQAGPRKSSKGDAEQQPGARKSSRGRAENQSGAHGSSGPKKKSKLGRKDVKRPNPQQDKGQRVVVYQVRIIIEAAKQK